MALYTGGYKVDTWIEVATGAITSATTHFDIDWNTHRGDDYKIFKVFLTDLHVADGLTFYARFLTANNTPASAGHYGGYYTHGEGNGDITQNDASYNNAQFIPIWGLRTAASLNGTYRGNLEFTVNTGNDVATGAPNYWWQGTARISTSLASHYGGAGTCTQNAKYGVRFESNTNTGNNILKARYKVLGMKNG